MTTMTTMTQTMTIPDHQRRALREMDSQELCDFQIRLQVECGMTHSDASDYVARALEGQLEF